MTYALIAAGVVYVFVTVVNAGAALLDWSVHRGLAKDYADQHLYARLQDEHERKAREAARRFTQAPLWPLTALGALVRIWCDSKEDTDE